MKRLNWYKDEVKELLKTKSIPWVLGQIHDWFQDYEIDEDEEDELYKLADQNDEFNSPAEYWFAMDPNFDFTDEEIEEWRDK